MTAAKTLGRNPASASVCFNCNQYRDSNHARCSNHYVRQEFVMDKLKHFLDSQMEIAVDVERLISVAHEMEKAPDGMRSRLASLHNQSMNMEAKLERLLEDVTTGILDRDEYARIKASYLKEQAGITQQEREAREEYEQIKLALGTAEAWLNEIRRYRKLPVVDRGIVDALVDRILVFENRDIHISLTYSDPYALLKTYLGDEGGINRAG